MVDALSPIYAIPGTSLALDLEAVAAAQPEDPESEMLREGSSSLFFFFFLPSDSCLRYSTNVCDISTGTPRRYVRSAFQQPVFDALHNASHLSIRASQRLITDLSSRRV